MADDAKKADIPPDRTREEWDKILRSQGMTVR